MSSLTSLHDPSVFQGKTRKGREEEPKRKCHERSGEGHGRHSPSAGLLLLKVDAHRRVLLLSSSLAN